ncbi:MAG: hypothetical protein ACI85I_000677 [Arenicella sp.]
MLTRLGEVELQYSMKLIFPLDIVPVSSSELTDFESSDSMNMIQGNLKATLLKKQSGRGYFCSDFEDLRFLVLEGIFVESSDSTTVKF